MSEKTDPAPWTRWSVCGTPRGVLGSDRHGDLVVGGSRVLAFGRENLLLARGDVC